VQNYVEKHKKAHFPRIQSAKAVMAAQQVPKVVQQRTIT
jgi:hypothetical protein